MMMDKQSVDGDDEQAKARTSQALANSYVAGMTFSACRSMLL